MGILKTRRWYGLYLLVHSTLLYFDELDSFWNDIWLLFFFFNVFLFCCISIAYLQVVGAHIMKLFTGPFCYCRLTIYLGYPQKTCCLDLPVRLFRRLVCFPFFGLVGEFLSGSQIEEMYVGMVVMDWRPGSGFLEVLYIHRWPHKGELSNPLELAIFFPCIYSFMDKYPPPTIGQPRPGQKKAWLLLIEPGFYSTGTVDSLPLEFDRPSSGHNNFPGDTCFYSFFFFFFFCHWNDRKLDLGMFYRLRRSFGDSSLVPSH